MRKQKLYVVQYQTRFSQEWRVGLEIWSFNSISDLSPLFSLKKNAVAHMRHLKSKHVKQLGKKTERKYRVVELVPKGYYED